MATQSSQVAVKDVLRTLDPKIDCLLEVLPGGKVSGNVVSVVFAGKDDSKRQRLIWDALDKHFGEAAPQVVGTLLAYTPDEWNVTLQD